jgi:hypothetical protein
VTEPQSTIRPHAVAGDSQLMPEDTYRRVATRANAKFTLPRQLVTAVVFVLIIVGLNYFAPAHSNPTERFYASLMLVLIAVPLWLWRLGLDPNPPFIVLVSLVYFLVYGFGVFLLERFSGNVYQADLAPRWVEAALRLSLAGFACMLAGYYTWPWMPMRAMIPGFRMRWRDPRAVRLAGFTLAIGGLLFAAGGIPGLPKALAQTSVYAQASCTIGVCVFIGLWRTRRLRRLSVVLLLAVLIPMRLGVDLLHGASGGAMAIVFTLILMYSALSHRIPWALIFVGVGGIFIIRPLEMPYRAATWSPRAELFNASPVRKMEYMSRLIYRVTVGGEVPPEALIQAAAGRLSMFPMLGDVMAQTPSSIPYWGGVTYYPLLFKPIPRAIWPDKPEEVTGRTFGHRYGYTSIENPGTSINLAQLIEQYANFGVLGVYFGMFIIGMIYRALLGMFVHPEMGFGALIAAVFVVSSLFDIGSGTAMVFGAIPWTLVYLFIVDRFVWFLHFELSGADQQMPVSVVQ